MGSAQSLFISTYSIDESQTTSNFFFKFYSGVSKLTKERVSLFVHQVTNPDVASFLSQGFKTLKKIRHPGLIKYTLSQEDDEGVTLVTQHLVPFKQMKEKLSEDEICMGIYSLLEAALFLESAELSHVYINEGSIFINPEDHKWKLGNPEFILSKYDNTQTTLEKIKEMLAPISKEEYPISENASYLIYIFIIRNIIPLIKNMRNTSLPWNDLEESLSQVQSITEMKKLPFFANNRLIIMDRTLIDFRLLSASDKEKSFKEIAEELHLIHPDSLEKFILPHVLRLDFFAEKECFPVYTSLCGSQVAIKKLLPFFDTAIKSKRLEIRLNLLKILPSFAYGVTPTYLHCELIPEVLGGLDEEDDELYIHSLQAVSFLIPLSAESYSFFSASNEGKTKEIIGPLKMTDLVVSHVMKNVAASLQIWDFIDIVLSLWRSIISLSIVQKRKAADLPLIFRQLGKTHHVLFQALNPEQKVEFISNRIVSERLLIAEESIDGNTSWLSRAIELAIPYLRDENKMVRKAVSDAIPKWISLIDDLYEGIPTISKSFRNSDHALGKLKEIYPLTIRVKKSFSRSIQRRSSRLSPESGHEILSSTPKTPYIDKNTLNAQRQANYIQWQESQSRGSLESESLYHITELPVDTITAKSLQTNYVSKDKSKREEDEDEDLELKNLRI